MFFFFLLVTEPFIREFTATTKTHNMKAVYNTWKSNQLRAEGKMTTDCEKSESIGILGRQFAIVADLIAFYEPSAAPRQSQFSDNIVQTLGRNLASMLSFTAASGSSLDNISGALSVLVTRLRNFDANADKSGSLVSSFAVSKNTRTGESPRSPFESLDAVAQRGDKIGALVRPLHEAATVFLYYVSKAQNYEANQAEKKTMRFAIAVGDAAAEFVKAVVFLRAAQTEGMNTVAAFFECHKKASELAKQIVVNSAGQSSGNLLKDIEDDFFDSPAKSISKAGPLFVEMYAKAFQMQQDEFGDI